MMEDTLGWILVVMVVVTCVVSVVGIISASKKTEGRESDGVHTKQP